MKIHDQARNGSWFVVFVCWCLFQSVTTAQEKPKLKVFILAGQSNMEGKGSIVTMQHQLKVPEKRDRFERYMNGDAFAERDDVWIDYLGGRGRRSGKLTAGYGISEVGSRKIFGPELGFGFTIGDHFDEPVLIIKTAWGGKSLDRDFRPPSRGIPDSAKEVVANKQKRNPELTLEEYEKGYGHFYRLMMEEINTVTNDLSTYVPGYEDQGFELSGFVWFQGWNDQYAPTSVADYRDNMISFIQDVRTELNAPELPFVIGAMGHGGANQSGKIKEIADAQAAVAEHEPFEGRVVTIRTADYWDMEAEEAFKVHWQDKNNRDVEKWREFGDDRPYHYYGSPCFFSIVGDAFAKAMIELLDE